MKAHECYDCGVVAEAIDEMRMPDGWSWRIERGIPGYIQSCDKCAEKRTPKHQAAQALLRALVFSRQAGLTKAEVIEMVEREYKAK